MMSIVKNMVVSMRYIIRNSKGIVLEDRTAAAPAQYLHGADGIELLLQAQLEGLKTGDKKTIYLLKDSGLADDDFSFEVTIDNVRGALPEEILSGRPVVKIDSGKCGTDCACNC